MKVCNFEGQAARKGGKIGKELQESFQRTTSIRKQDALVQAMVGCSPGPTNKELRWVLGSTPGLRGKTAVSSRAFHIAGPCDSQCDRLAHYWGAISSGGLRLLGMAGSQINLCISCICMPVWVHSPGL